MNDIDHIMPVMSENGTGPIRAAGHVFGLTEAEIRPFEPADIDWSALSEQKIKNPTYGQNQVPGAIVNSCSECCMTEINGKPNLLGRLHKNSSGPAPDAPSARPAITSRPATVKAGNYISRTRTGPCGP